MNFATQNYAAHRMRNVNPPGYTPYGSGDQYGVGHEKFGAPTRSAANDSDIADLISGIVEGLDCAAWLSMQPNERRRYLFTHHSRPFRGSEEVDRVYRAVDAHCAGTFSKTTLKQPGATESQPSTTAPMPQTGAATPTMTPDGRVSGIDGMLNQVAEALVKQVSLDEKMQERVGAAAGKALAITLLEGLFVGWVLKTAWDALPTR